MHVIERLTSYSLDNMSVTYEPPALKTLKTLSEEKAQFWSKACRDSVNVNYRTATKVPTQDEIKLDLPRPFQCQSFDHPSIRLVHLLPELSPAGLLQCSILRVSNKNCYVCLSYVWDVSPSHLSVSAQGNLDNKVILINHHPFLVRANLFDSLWIARYNATRSDWDLERSICPFLSESILFVSINQMPEEGTIKGGQMAAIYMNALHVHVWVGIALPLETDIHPLSSMKSPVYQRRTMVVKII